MGRLALTLLFTVRLNAQVLIDDRVVNCCESTFSMRELVRYSRVILKQRREHLVARTVLPPGDPLRIVDGMDPTIQSSLFLARGFAEGETFAYIIRTAEGAAVYRWDHRTQSGERVILSGADPLLTVRGLTLAGLSHKFYSGYSRAHIPRVNVVVQPDRSLADTGEALTAGGEILNRLKIDTAEIAFRRDPWFWPDQCAPIYPPIQWGQVFPNPEAVDRKSYYCLFEPGVNPSCREINTVYTPSRPKTRLR